MKCKLFIHVFPAVIAPHTEHNLTVGGDAVRKYEKLGFRIRLGITAAALLLALLSLLMVWGELSGAAAAAPQEPGVVDGA